MVKQKISFPKNTSSQINQRIIEEDEPFFTESNFNTSNNVSLINGNDSTKLTYSTNKKSVSAYGENNINESNKDKDKDKDKGKNNVNLDEKLINSFQLNSTKNNKDKDIKDKKEKNVKDSKEIIDKNLKNKKDIKENNNKKLKDIIPFDKSDKKFFNFETTKIDRKISRNNKKRNLRVRSYDNKYEKYTKKEVEKNIQKQKKIKVLSYDDIYNKKGRMPGDFVPFKSKKELVYKHVNIISSDDSIDKKPKIKVYPSIKFNEVKSSQNLKYKKLGDDPRYMYVDYYRNHKKTHKSHLFDILKKS